MCKRPRVILRLPLLVSLLIVLASAVRIFRDPAAIHPDCALNLQLGQLILDGKVPYVDFFEINPPLIMYLNTIPAFISKVCGFSIIPVFQVFVLILMVWSLLECWILTRPLRRFGVDRFMVLMLAMASILVLLQGEFGQREHLFMLVYLPYLFLRLNREEEFHMNLLHSVVLGIAAGLGLCLKPHFLIIAFIIEMISLSRHKSIRILFQPESISIVVVVSLYVMHLALVPAEMREEFFSRWIPFISKRYSAYNALSFSGRWIPWVQGCWPVDTHASRGLRIAISLVIRSVQMGVFLWGINRLIRAMTPVHRHVFTFIVLMFACLVLFWIQRKGFPYHQIPFDFAFFGLVPVVCTPMESPNPGRSSFKRGQSYIVIFLSILGILLSLSAALGIPGGFHGTGGETRSVEERSFCEFLKQHPRQGERVVVISTKVSPAYPAILQFGLEPGSRYIWSFPIAFIYEPSKTDCRSSALYHTLQEQTPEESRVLLELEEDIQVFQPKLIAVRNSSKNTGLPYGFNLLEYLRFTGWIDRALVSYQSVDSPESWQMFLRTE
jgi:hypothetical protein